MATVIKSAENRLIKLAASLQRTKQIRRAQLYLAEGIHLTEEALRSPVEIVHAFVKEEPKGEVRVLWDQLEARGVVCSLVPMRLIEKICDAKTPQGIVLMLRLPEAEPHLRSDGNFLLLEAIQDPGNVGNMIRTAESFNFDGILLCGMSAEPYSSKAVRSSMGSVFRLPVLYYNKVEEAAAAVKKAGLKLFTAELYKDSVFPEDLPGTGLCVAIGNEGRGISAELSALADGTVRIPMSGKTESLSAPCAAAILLWEIFRKGAKS